ncbi:ATP-binding cassette sub-family A member 5 [Armadillidium vulgare]|nr:ATP-binding cassette sub-family A member 5 [Armadillidium vulgare]
MLRDTDLNSKADTKADDLSGGQKRKLSIGIALIGDPKIVFLDEPTAGVDAYSRRNLWALLKKRKHDKVILLTTHFMDEADILAERKAIVSKGKLRCYGTSMFLKNKFGIGYHLTLVISDSDDAVKSVEKKVKGIIPNADIIRHYGKELSFILPSTSSHLFTKLFKTLDSSMEDAGVVTDIESYGISMTTLEEVFLALNEEDESKIKIDSVENIGRELIRTRSKSITSNHSHERPSDSKPVTGRDSDENSHHSSDNTEDFDLDQIVVERNDWRAFKALVKLRVLNLSREIAALVFLILFPLGFVVGSMALADSMSVTFSNDDLLLLNTGLYTLTDNNVALIYNETGKDLSAFDSLLRQSQLTPQEYNGSYRFLYDNQPHFSAFDVYSIDPDKVSLTVRYNTSYAQILPILINIVDNAYMSYFTDGKSKISTYSQQFPILESEKTEFDFGTYFSPVMIGFVFTMIPAGLVIDIVYDREMNGQNILRLNGVGFNMYFGSFFLVIGVLYFISYIGLLIIIQAFQVPSLTVGAAYACLALLYLIYMPSALIFSCCVSYTFDKHRYRSTVLPQYVDILGDPDVAFALHVVFTIFVSYYIPFGALYYVNKVYINHSLANDTDSLTMSDYMTKEIIIMFVVCIVDIFLYYILLRIIYSVKLGGGIKDALWIKKKNSFVESLDETEDSASLVNADKDVKKERAKNLSKTYGKSGLAKKFEKGKKKSKDMTAVKNVSFEVLPGQVFGLLGPNGAGKTSLIRIMNAEERPSQGKVIICGYNITSSLSDAYQYLGYCPQFDCLWNKLHVDEHIECFANISGVREDQVER